MNLLAFERASLRLALVGIHDSDPRNRRHVEREKEAASRKRGCDESSRGVEEEDEETWWYSREQRASSSKMKKFGDAGEAGCG